MAISLLNNISALEAQNQLQSTQAKLQNTLFQLSSGSRINSGADDAAGLAIANGLQANITALSQSSSNATNGVGALQVADGALAQVTTLLNRAVTLATESASGTVGANQRGALQAEYAQIQAEIDNIGQTTSYNGSQVFNNLPASVFLSDGTNNTIIQANQINLSSAGLLGSGSSASLAATAFAANDTVTVGGTTYTFVAPGTQNAQGGGSALSAANATGGTAAAVKVVLDTNTNESGLQQLQTNVANLAAAINGGAGAGIVYQAIAGGNGNVDATASANGTSVTFNSTPAGFAAFAAGAVPVATTAAGATILGATAGAFTAGNGSNLSSAGAAQSALASINAAIAVVASDRGNIGAVINRLQAASNVESVQVQNLTAAEDQITAANIPQQVTNLSEFSILNQSGISALAQANSSQQSILKLLQ